MKKNILITAMILIGTLAQAQEVKPQIKIENLKNIRIDQIKKDLAKDARVNGGSEGTGGGDICEDRIKLIRDDLKLWIQKGGPQSLSLPSGVSADNYAQRMLEQISKASIRCVGPGDEGYPVLVYNTPKICKFDLTASSSKITCDIKKFLDLGESDQYVLVHHEYAGLTQIEPPNGDDSNYGVSNQITSYLVNQVVKRLAVKSTSKAPASDWKVIDGKEAVETMRALQEMMAVAKFEDCDFGVRPSSAYTKPMKCAYEDYYPIGFLFEKKGHKNKDGFSSNKYYDDDYTIFTCGSSQVATGSQIDNLTYIMVSTSGRPAIRLFNNRASYQNATDDNGREIEQAYRYSDNPRQQADRIFYLDETRTKIVDYYHTRSNVEKKNVGSISVPEWVDTAVPRKILTCHASNK